MTRAQKHSRFLPTSEDFRYEEFPFYWLARAHRIYNHQMEKILKKLGADVPTRRVLLLLQNHGTLSISEIATHSVIKLSTITRIVQRMREDELVQTSTNVEDARITDVAMTPRGEKLLADIQQATHKIFVRGYTGFTEAQLKRLSQDLERLFNNLADD
ncbi:MarR family winged helix-turn-helix transcriptional regulator [Zoogloea sp.]|uniref:MarR family winged helix-turn-helix transcriptional regulator n=1 Tax=Zoogloea sp. TaxID=49181 RepID=UPI0035B45D35